MTEGSDLLHTFERELRHSTEQMQEMLLEIERPRSLAPARRRRIIAQLRVVHREVDRVDAEPIDADREQVIEVGGQPLAHLGPLRCQVAQP